MVSPACSSKPDRDCSAYSRRKARNWVVSRRRGLVVALTSTGSSVSPVSMTKSTSVPPRRAPIADLGGIQSRVPPRHEVAEDEILEVPRRRFGVRQSERETGVGPVQLRGLDQPGAPVDGVGREPQQQIRGFEQVQIAMHRRLGQRDVTSDLRLVGNLPDAHADGAHEPAVVDQRRDGRQRGQVAFQIRAYVPVQPDRAFPGIGEVQGRVGEATPFSRRTSSPRVWRAPIPEARAIGGPGWPGDPPNDPRYPGRVARAGSSAKASGSWHAPASDSDTWAIKARFADPVIRNCPGRPGPSCRS